MRNLSVNEVKNVNGGVPVTFILGVITDGVIAYSKAKSFIDRYTS